MDVYNEEHRTRLFKAMQQSYQNLDPFRQMNLALISDYAGPYYGSPEVVPLPMANLMNQAVDAYVMSLVANRPRVTVETQREELRFFARHFAVAINNYLQQINIEETLRRWVTDAFFMIGIVKVHMGNSQSVQLYDGTWIDPGAPMASNVALDDFVYDMSATRWDQVQFCGDHYRVPLSYLENGPFDPDVVAELEPTSKHWFVGWGQRTEALSRGGNVQDADDIEPMVDLIDVWLRREGQIATFAMDQSGTFSGKLAPLGVVEWIGSERGPYPILSFQEVPENLMPSSPAAHLLGLERLVNVLLRKQGRKAKLQKDINLFSSTDPEAVARIKNARDNEYIHSDDPSAVNVLKQGGVDASTQQFLLNSIDLFDRMAGNLPSMLGLGPQAETLGQEQLIAGAVSKKAGQLAMRCQDATRTLVRNLAHMIWRDAARVIPGRMQIPGVEGATIDATWTPDYRMGEFFDYDLDIDVYLMGYQPPSQKVNSLNQLLTQIYLPLAPALQQQGGSLNMQALTDIFAELLHLPRLKEVVQFSMPDPMEGGGGSGGGQTAPKPASTTRNYVRRSVPTGGTVQGRSVASQQAWSAIAGQSAGGNGTMGA